MSTSIYAHVDTRAPAAPDQRRTRRARARARLTRCRPDQPPLRLDRDEALQRALRAGGDLAPLRAALEREVEAMEQWAAGLPVETQQDGTTVRRALELLRRFGRLSTMDFSAVAVEDRGTLVRILALEHRWCYAAAGTTREVFKEVTGRTGAR